MPHLPKDLLLTLRTRAARNRLSSDPDTVHGVLMLAEQRADAAEIAAAVNMPPAALGSLLEDARAGRVIHVRAYRGSGAQAEYADWEVQKMRHAARKRAERRRIQ